MKVINIVNIIITIIISFYIICNIVELCKKEYIESYINYDKNTFITIFQNKLETHLQVDHYPNIIYEIMKNTLLIIIAISFLVIINIANFEIKPKKFSKIVPI